MASIHSEYQRFLIYLAQQEVHDDVLRLAHLVLDHLQTLAEVGTARRGRSARLTPLAVENMAQMPVDFGGELHGQEVGSALGRLHQLDVGPFRGFMRQETFDLSHDITLVYGANGSGKSSFCEALEVAMLGSISEAQVKRVDQRVYCNNARLRHHIPPFLLAKGEGEPEIVQPDEREFRFCFIEKNRLDDFARIAARTPGDQRQLIATLFGVDQFSEFVRGFNPSLDPNLMLVGAHASQLEERRKQLASAEQAINGHSQKVASIEEQENLLAQRMFSNVTYLAFVDWLLGTQQIPGRLSQVRAQLDAIPPTIHGVTPARLQSLLDAAYRVHGQWTECSAQLSARASDVSYSKLYEMVLQLAEGATTCPACGTGLDAVAQNPFDKARHGLDQLEQLSALQKSESNLEAELNEAMRTLWGEMCRVVSAAINVCPEELQAAGLPVLPSAFSGDWLGEWVNGDRQPWEGLIRIAESIERADEQAREVHSQRSALTQERDRLEEHRLEIERLRTLRASANQELLDAEQTVAFFDEANRELIQAAADEVPIIAHHHRIKAAYDGFLPELQGYLTSLPGVLLQGLGEQARDLYNAFNRGDPRGDLLNALWLPVAENGKIEVEFACEPGTRYDALILLS
ncbi:AAA family ATPase [Vreelandella titanicae]|uniref:AAA family ATPase n=1 Tax=Vreelandella titanicae TaxID=664683 RepID=UPI0021BD25DB|nr:AAA family ATPase [Halomonas titanicae]